MKLIEGVYIFILVACFAGNCACISYGTSVTSSTAVRYQAAVICPLFMCSGAIVSSRNVLTTATCVKFLSPSDVKVHVGSNKYDEGGYTFNVANIIQHPRFDPSTFDFNLAILTVETPFNFGIGTTVQSITLATVLPPTNAYAAVTGFGAVNSNLDNPGVLQYANLLIYATATCQVYKRNRLTQSMLCVGDPRGQKDCCPGDQGAPAVYNGNLVGLYSWGCSCGLASPDPSSPVFTSIPYLKAWIQLNITP